MPIVRDVGTEGKLGQAAASSIEVRGVSQDVIESMNLMAANPTSHVRNIAEVTTAVANGDLSTTIIIDVRGEFLELKDTVNSMVDQRDAFARDVTRVIREVGVEGALGGQARSTEISVVEGSDRQRRPARGQPHRPGPCDREGFTRCCGNSSTSARSRARSSPNSRRWSPLSTASSTR